MKLSFYKLLLGALVSLTISSIANAQDSLIYLECPIRGTKVNTYGSEDMGEMTIFYEVDFKNRVLTDLESGLEKDVTEMSSTHIKTLRKLHGWTFTIEISRVSGSYMQKHVTPDGNYVKMEGTCKRIPQRPQKF